MVFSNINHSKVPRQCLHNYARGHTKMHFHIALDIILVERKSFGNTELSSNSIKVNLHKLPKWSKEEVNEGQPIHEPLFWVFWAQANICY